MSNIYIEGHNEIYHILQTLKEVMDGVVQRAGYTSPVTGETLLTYDSLVKELESLESEIKKEIREGSDLSETEYFAIRKTVTYEYDPEKIRNIIPKEAFFYIQTKESIKKAELDKAIKDGLVPEKAKEALREKSVSISFIDKKKIAEREVKEVSV